MKDQQKKVKKEPKGRKITGKLDSCFKIVTAVVHFHLSPSNSGNIPGGIIDYLNKFLLKYIVDFQGVVLSYNSIKLKEQKARIYNENPFLHFEGSVDFQVFSPSPSSKMKCIVNKQSEDHIGGLVYGIFNVTIPSPPNLCWSSENQRWEDRQTDQSSPPHIEIGQQLEFYVADIKHGNDVLIVYGSLEPTI